MLLRLPGVLARPDQGFAGARPFACSADSTWPVMSIDGLAKSASAITRSSPAVLA